VLLAKSSPGFRVSLKRLPTDGTLREFAKFRDGRRLGQTVMLSVSGYFTIRSNDHCRAYFYRRSATFKQAPNGVGS
jgi:hypothetical protein